MTEQKSTRGGAREGSGRKPLKDRKVTTISLTEDLHKKWTALGGSPWMRKLLEEIQIPSTNMPPGAMVPAKNLSKVTIPLATCSVRAGFPSPAESYVDKEIDLNEMVIQKPCATVMVRTEGDSMDAAGIFEGDMLFVDRSREPRNGDIVIMEVNGEFTVKRFRKDSEGVRLLPESYNKIYKPIVPRDGDEWHFFGVVTHSLRSF